MEFIYLATAHFMALLSPGPDFFLIIGAAVRLPLRYVIAIAAGIAVANACYIFCALLAFEIILSQPWISMSLRYLGAVYLLFLGFMLLKNSTTASTTPASCHILDKHSFKTQFSIGFLSGILNPKNILFYFSLFTVIVAPETPLLRKYFYGLWMSLVVFSWDSFLAIAIAHGKNKSKFLNFIQHTEKFTGLILAAFGVSLLIF